MRKELSTGIYVAKHQFNGTTVIKHPEQELMNLRLQRLITDFNRLIYDYEAKQLLYYPQTIITAYLNRDKKHITLILLANEYNTERKLSEKLSIGTIKIDKNRISILAAYLKHSKQEQVALYNLNNTWGNGYIAYLKTLKQANT